MILLLYNLLLLVALLVSAPWWLWQMAHTHKYREGLAERLGRVPPHLRMIQRPVLWLHAVSVGEILAASRLIAELDRAFPGYSLVISTTTRTGQDLARQRYGADRVFYCPLDLPWAIRAYLEALQPRMLILAETEFWPNLLSGCFRRGIHVAVVNARISDRSWPRYRLLRPLWRPFLSQLSRVLAQSRTDAQRLRALGCSPTRVTVSGNIKFDVRAPETAEATLQLRALGFGQRFVVAGSTLEGEEEALLDAWPRLLAADPNLVLILAPRHPERFGAVADLMHEYGYPCLRRSKWTRQAEAPHPFKPGAVFLLDSIGELASVYSLASVAFVGGSIVPEGGHNPLEPAQFGVPIVMGPYYANFRAITDTLRAQNAVRIVSASELADVLVDLLRNRSEAAAMGERAKTVFEQQAGATDRTLHALTTLLDEEGIRS